MEKNKGDPKRSRKQFTAPTLIPSLVERKPKPQSKGKSSSLGKRLTVLAT
jgi:hypothetical protein